MTGTPLTKDARLKQLARTCRRPKPHQINLVGIWEETRDIHNSEVAKTIDEVCKNYYRHGTDVAKWHQLSTKKYINPACRDPRYESIIDDHFIKEAEAGHYNTATDITVRCRVPFFIKEEGENKYRFIPDYSHPKGGVSVNTLVPEADASVQLLSKFDLVEFAYNDGTTQALGKNDFKSWYRQIPLKAIRLGY